MLYTATMISDILIKIKQFIFNLTVYNS